MAKKFPLSVIVIVIVIVILATGIVYYIWQDIKQSTYDVDSIDSIPNLDRPVNIPSNLPEDAQKIVKERIEFFTAQLKQNPDSFENWNLLAIYRKTINDYQASQEIWEYLKVIYPKSYLVFNNLGDLYTYYLKDYQKAEENFKKAIENGPDQIFIYRSFYEFYRYVMKDDAKAKAVLEQGIKANPNTSQDLQNLLINF